MEDLLKYQRIEGSVEAISRRGLVVASAIETNFVVLGTDTGELQIVSFAGKEIRHCKAHTKPITSLSLVHAEGALTVLSCAFDGRVVCTVLSAKNELKESAVSLNKDLTCVCVERDFSAQTQSLSSQTQASAKRERSFLAGTAQGALLYHRPSWFAHKVVTLFQGERSPVREIAWKGQLVAWADATAVRLMDLSTQTAICQVSAPPGVSLSDTLLCPVSLFWENHEELWISWADSFRILRVRDAETERVSLAEGLASKTAKTTTSWTTDAILCGAFPLDNEHIVYLSFSPGEELQEIQELIEESAGAAGEDSLTLASATRLAHTLVGSLSSEMRARLQAMHEPELVVARRKDGAIVSADALPLRGCNAIGGSAYRLLSSVQCSGGSEDNNSNKNFSVQRARTQRGGDRGEAPLLFVVAAEDLVCARVRDADDRVCAALRERDLKHAVELAQSDPLSLRSISFADLLSLYIEQLLATPPSASLSVSVSVSASNAPVSLSAVGRIPSSSSPATLSPSSLSPSSSSSIPTATTTPPPAITNIGSAKPLSAVAQREAEAERDREAARECARLLGRDASLWEKWVARFVELRKTESIAALIPTTQLRLKNAVYESVLKELSRTRERSLLGDSSSSSTETTTSRLLLDIVKRWSKVSPPLFDHAALLQRLSRATENTTRAQRALFLEAQAQLFLVAHSYEKALNCYLDIDDDSHCALMTNAPPSSSTAAAGATNAAAAKMESEQEAKNNEYRHVFELIEKQNLFKLVENKIANLVRLSRPLTAKLLLTHLDKLPIRLVVQQLASSSATTKPTTGSAGSGLAAGEKERDRRLLLWYLHLLFRDSAARELYANKEFADLHRRQTELYAEFAPPFVRTPLRSEREKENEKDTMSNRKGAEQELQQSRARWFQSDLMVFIRSGLAPLDVALAECEKRGLYPEMVATLSLMDKRRTALTVLLREIGDIPLAIQFIEDQLDRVKDSDEMSYAAAMPPPPATPTVGTPTSISSRKKRESSSNKRDSTNPDSIRSMHDALLWNDLIVFCLEHPLCLQSLLDQLGVCKLEAHKVLAKIQPHTEIAGLKQRLMRIVQELKFQREQDALCKEILQKDAIALLCQKNHGQRRALRVDPQLRCAACLRPLATDAPVNNSLSASGSAAQSLLPVPKHDIQIWGQESRNDALVFSNKLAFHRQCYDRLPQ